MSSSPYDDRTVEPDVPASANLLSKGSPTPAPFSGPPPSYTPVASGSSQSQPAIPTAIGSSAFVTNSSTVAGDQIQDRRFSGADTLDEPVVTTLMRDVRAVGRRVKQVLSPKSEPETDPESGAVIRDWDLWGPLVFCLVLSLMLSIAAPDDQNSLVFSGVFAFVWIAEAFVTLNIKLLGGSISFFHAVCILGYALFPLVPAAIFSLAVKRMLIRFPIDVALVAWSLFASTRTLKGAGVRAGRVVLALYPVWLFYGWLGWLCVIT
ncbi:hypothetical protein V1512DRAFT_242002 [Lipomyces arxii]|uniref:uncharacterized protein n=1 Tax=Lipomyces arxii TaxID=56418 RepID=UPI0034CFA78A